MMIVKNMIRLFHPVIQSLQVAFLMLAVCGVDTVLANPGNSSNDEIFGGQILSLTAKIRTGLSNSRHQLVHH